MVFMVERVEQNYLRDSKSKINLYSGFASYKIDWTLIFNVWEKVKPLSRAHIVVGSSELPQVSLCWLKTRVYMVLYKQLGL